MNTRVIIKGDGVVITNSGQFNMREEAEINKTLVKLDILSMRLRAEVEHIAEAGEYHNTPIINEAIALAQRLYKEDYEAAVEKHYHRYEKEFPSGQFNIPEDFLDRPWEDTSWHNDACPSFASMRLRLYVYVDDARPEYRMTPNIQYVVCTYEGDDDNCWQTGEDIFQCESMQDLIDFINAQ